jgi:hypothetical protein
MTRVPRVCHAHAHATRGPEVFPSSQHILTHEGCFKIGGGEIMHNVIITR